MNVTIKLLTGETFPVQLEGSQTVGGGRVGRCARAPSRRGPTALALPTQPSRGLLATGRWAVLRVSRCLRVLPARPLPLNPCVRCVAQVTEVRAMLVESKGYTAEGMKLIYAGAVLSDSQTMEGAGVKEGDFIVCVVRKSVRARRGGKGRPAAAV